MEDYFTVRYSTIRYMDTCIFFWHTVILARIIIVTANIINNTFVAFTDSWGIAVIVPNFRRTIRFSRVMTRIIPIRITGVVFNYCTTTINVIISYKIYNIQNKMHLNLIELSLKADVITFEYITLLIYSSDQKYIIFVNSVNLLKNRFCAISEVLMVELLLTTVKKLIVWVITRTNETK